MKRSVCTLWLCLLFAAGHALAGDKSKPIVAAFDMEVNGVDLEQYQVELLSNYLSTRLAESGQFEVIPREQVRRRLADEKRDSYKACFDESCQIELGKELAAEKSLATQLSKIGTKCTVTMTLYDLRKAAAEAGATVRGGCSMDEVMESLVEAVDKLAAKVSEANSGAAWGGKVTVTELGIPAGVDTGKEIVNPIVDNTGFLFVDSEPRGATILINGQEKGKTPYRVEMMVGDYVVVCAKGGLYFPVRQKIRLSPKGVRLNMALKPDFGILRVVSDPPGARIFINGEPSGRETPFTFDPKRAGEYAVRLEKPLYLSRSVKVRLGEGRESVVEQRLEANFGGVKIESSPQGIDVYLDGSPTGKKTPVFLAEVAAGLHQVEIRSSQYHSESRQVNVRTGQVQELDFALKGKYGLLVVTADVVDGDEQMPAQAEVWVDGEKMPSATPYKDRFLVGQYRVEVRTGEARPFTTSVRIEEGKKSHVQARLRKLNDEEARLAREMAMLSNKERRHREWLLMQRELEAKRSHYNWAGGGLAALGGASFVSGLYLLAIVLPKTIDQRDQAFESWLLADPANAPGFAARIDRLERRGAKQQLAGFVTLGAGAVLAATGAVVLLFKPEVPEHDAYVEAGPSVSLLPQLTPDGGGVLLNWQW